MDDPSSERISELQKQLEDEDCFGVDFDPFSTDDRRAYVTAFHRIWSDYEGIVEEGSPFYDYLDNAISMTKFMMCDAFAEWVFKKFGEDAEAEAESLFEKGDIIQKFYQDRHRRYAALIEQDESKS